MADQAGDGADKAPSLKASERPRVNASKGLADLPRIPEKLKNRGPSIGRAFSFKAE